MKFFNPKEEVIDIQLTPYGRRLLAKGELRPVYYAFYDDDILYDGALGGVTENQNETQERIKNNTPRLQTQGVHESIRSTIGQNLEILDSQYQYQTFKESEHILGLPLGQSSLSGNVAPAWDVKYYHNKLNECSSYITSSGGTLRVPQLDSRIEYTTYVSYLTPDGGAPTPEMARRQQNYVANSFPSLDEEPGESDPPTPGPSVYLENYVFDDYSKIFVKEDGVFLDVREANTQYLRENFDIEVYISDIEDGEEKNTSQLYFRGDVLSDPTPANVEYWLDIAVDGEIPETVYCQLQIPLTKKETLGDSVYGCPDLSETKKSTVLRNLYAQVEPDEEPC